MLVVDAHVHIFEKWAGINNGAPNTSYGYGRIKNGNQILQVMPPAFERSDCTLENLIANMDCHQIDKAVVFSNGGYGYCNDYILESVKKFPGRLCALALVDIPKGKTAADELDCMMKRQGFKGVKYEGLSCFECSGQMPLDDGRIMPVWEALHANDGIGIFHLCRKDDLSELKRIKKAFPKLKIVLAHFGGEAVFNYFDENWEEVLDFAKTDNVWLESSSVSNYLKEQIDFSKTISLIEQAVKRLGAGKVLWGSDYPCMTLYATYYQILHMIVDGCKIGYDEVCKIVGKNADNLFFNK